MTTVARRRHALNIITKVCGVLWSIWVLVPWTPEPFAQGLRDASYTIFSHIAFAEGRPWGAATTLHTGGPLGFLRFPVFYEPTYAYLLLGNAAIAAIVALLLDEILRNQRSRARLPIVVVVTGMLSLDADAVWMFVLLASQILIPDVCRSARWSLRPDPRWLTWPLVLSLVACALAANVKATFFLMASILAVELAALELWERRAPAVSVAFVLGVGCFGWFAGLRISDWEPYTRHVIGSLSGYAEAFSVAGSPARAAILFVSVLMFLTAVAFRAAQSSDRFDAFVRWTALAMLVSIDAKGALLRQDFSHELRVVVSLGIFFALHTMVYHHELSFSALPTYLAPVVGLTIVVVLTLTQAQRGELSSSPKHPIEAAVVERRLSTFRPVPKRGMAAAVARDAEARLKVANEIERPWPPTSSIAAFGSYQSLLLGHPGRIVSLAIVVPYEIWSPWTSRRQREYLKGPDAPEYLLYTQSPASAKVAVMLTARYAEVSRGSGYRLLHRRPVALAVTKRLVFEKLVGAGETIEIPPEWRTGPAVAEVEYTKTFTGVLISALYQPAEAYIALFRGSSPFAKIRMNALLSAEGVVLSSQPGVWDGRPAALHGMRFGLLTDERVEATTLKFEASGLAGAAWNTYFRPDVYVRIYIPEFM